MKLRSVKFEPRNANNPYWDILLPRDDLRVLQDNYGPLKSNEALVDRLNEVLSHLRTFEEIKK